MRVEIWSDVMCPFCYIGKRRFEDALKQFKDKDKIEIEWKSFQLNPDMVTNPSVNINQYLADAKGWTLDYARQMNSQVTGMAAEVGLTYHLDNAIVANSFNAHRFTHFAKQHHLGAEAEEQLFKAYFTDSRNIDDANTLAETGAEIGLNRTDVLQMLQTDAYADAVTNDIAEAEFLGISGVPFFVMNGRYAVSGAQAVPVFTETLTKAFDEWQSQRQPLEVTVQQGQLCGQEGDCK